jgi:ribosomal protein S12 methylthiotransferase accessory factor
MEHVAIAGSDPAMTARAPDMTESRNRFFATGEADPDLLARLGITRVGEIAGLDSIGIPVWFATRPNSRGLSVAQGKGLSAAQARISAVMEAAEGAVAERPEDIVRCFGDLAGMKATGRAALPFERLTRCHASQIMTSHRYAWGQGSDLATGQAIFAPYELLGLDLRAETPWDHAAFRMSSIGLAAGHDRNAVIAHALLEAIEHDATATLDLLGWVPATARRIDCVPGAHAELDALMASVVCAGFEPHFFALSGRVALPVVACFFAREVLSEAGIAATLTAGFACRPDAGDAAAAALLECVQSRATDIAGARDDIKDMSYRGSRARLPDIELPGLTLAEVRGHRLRKTLPTSETQCDHVMACLKAAGIETAYVFDLEPPEMPLHVVRVLIPDLGCSGEGAVIQGGAGMLDALLRVS